MKHKKKIALFLVGMDKGGVERVVSILLQHLHHTFDFHLVLLEKTIRYPLPPEIKVHFLDTETKHENGLLKIIKIPILAYKYFLFCKNNNIALSLSFLNRPNFIASFTKIYGATYKVVISERSFPSLRYKEGLSGIIGRFLIKSLYKNADIIIPNSKRTAQDLQENFGLKTPIQVIYNPIDISFVRAKMLMPTTLPFFKGVTFVHVGRFNTVKNHELLVEVFSRLPYSDCRLVLIGDGELKTKIQKQVRYLGIEHKVVFMGNLDNPFSVMKQSSCLVLSSDYEGFPNALLEGLVCGLPIISTDCSSGPREILAPQTDYKYQLNNTLEMAEYGILTPVNNPEILFDAMNLLYKSPEKRQEYAQKSAYLVSSFDTENIIQQFSNALVEPYLPNISH